MTDSISLSQKSDVTSDSYLHIKSTKLILNLKINSKHIYVKNKLFTYQ
jgi:hypothetical protein